MNNYQAGTVDSRVDRNEQGIKPKTYRGYRMQVFQKTNEDLERIRDPLRLVWFWKLPLWKM
jgi:hypothetical protein